MNQQLYVFRASIRPVHDGGSGCSGYRTVIAPSTHAAVALLTDLDGGFSISNEGPVHAFDDGSKKAVQSKLKAEEEPGKKRGYEFL